MKSFAATVVAAVLVALLASHQANGFSVGSQFTGSSIKSSVQNAGSESMTMEYIPSGMSKEQYRKFKEEEQKKTAGKNLGKVGITTFKSRSFADWQASGGKNLFPVDPTKVKNAKEIPYMQRPGGAPDDSDLAKPSGGFFNFGKKAAAKKQPEPEPVKKSTNWWTL